MQKLAIKGPQRPQSRGTRSAGPGADLRFWACLAVLFVWSGWAMVEYVRLQTEQVKMGRRMEELKADRAEHSKALSNYRSQVQKYQTNTRYIERAIREFKLDLKGNTQANVVKVDAYGNVLRGTPSGTGVFVEAR
jgi:hypothetical protein